MRTVKKVADMLEIILLLMLPFSYATWNSLRLPIWGAEAVALVGCVGIIAVWLIRRRWNRIRAAEYLGISVAGGMFRGVRKQRQSVMEECRRRCGPEAAFLAGRGARKIQIGQNLIALFGAISYCGLMITIGIGRIGEYLTGFFLLCIGGSILVIAGIAETKTAGEQVKELGGVAESIGADRVVYLNWCETQGREPYPYD